MRRRGRGAPRPAALAVFAVLANGCGPAEHVERDGQRLSVTIDSTVGPGTIFRHGPATERMSTRRPSGPIVAGDSGQISVYDGYFVQAPCSEPLRVQASLAADTIRVRLFSSLDTAAAGPCAEGVRPSEYSLLVGQFEPGEYVVHVRHEGDLTRETALDTLYRDIRILPPRARRVR